MRAPRLLLGTLLAFLSCMLCPPATTAQVPSELKVHPVAGGVFMLEGRGGNIGLLIGTDGAFLIDDQFAPATPEILKRVQELTDQPLRFLVNTHWHGDHTGGNENLGKLGAVIVAHDNVRRRMSTDQFMEAFQREVPASPPAALPVITFAEEVTFHWNGEEVHVFHVAHAHTDGDSIVHFKKANVIHMGDCYFAGGYPFIDLSSGGHVDGVIAAAGRVLAMANDETRIIPGHGALSNVKELRAYRDLLVTLRDAVAKLIEDGKTLKEITAAAPHAAFDAAWGGGFIDGPALIATIHACLAPAASKKGE